MGREAKKAAEIEAFFLLLLLLLLFLLQLLLFLENGSLTKPRARNVFAKTAEDQNPNLLRREIFARKTPNFPTASPLPRRRDRRTAAPR